MTVSAGIGFVYGPYRFFRDESALYVRMIIFSVGCAMFWRLFETLQYLVNGEIGSGFHVGMLGIIGSFMFLFSANYGQMGSVVDDRSAKFRKTRIISLAAPVALLVLCGTVFVTCPAGLLDKLSPDWMNGNFWAIVILVYYLPATLLPIDKLKG